MDKLKTNIYDRKSSSKISHSLLPYEGNSFYLIHNHFSSCLDYNPVCLKCQPLELKKIRFCLFFQSSVCASLDCSGFQAGKTGFNAAIYRAAVSVVRRENRDSAFYGFAKMPVSQYKLAKFRPDLGGSHKEKQTNPQKTGGMSNEFEDTFFRI